MRQFWLVVKFELETMVKKKSFTISIALVALAAFALLSLPRFFNNDQGTSDEGSTASEAEKTMMIYDASNAIVNKELIEQSLPDYKIVYEQDLEQIKSKVLNGEVEAGMEIKEPLNFTYYVKNSSLMDETPMRFQEILQIQYQWSELGKLNYDASKVRAIYQAPAIYEMSVLGTDGSSNYYYTYALIMVAYMMILIYGNQIGVSVASEKSNRAIEILTTSCSSNALIFGKVIAGAVTGALQTFIMLGSCLLSYQINADVWNHALDPFLNIPASVLITFALFGVLGYLLFSFLFGAIGACCSKVEEVNGATMPIQLFIIAVFIAGFITLQFPDSLVATILCYVPFTSWMCMFINVAVGSVTMIEIVISLALLVLTTIATGMVGAKLYRRGTLATGNTIKFKHMLHMLKQKD